MASYPMDVIVLHIQQHFTIDMHQSFGITGWSRLSLTDSVANDDIAVAIAVFEYSMVILSKSKCTVFPHQVLSEGRCDIDEIKIVSSKRLYVPVFELGDFFSLFVEEAPTALVSLMV